MQMADRREYDEEEVAKSYEYLAESHNVVTPDGYILTLHRLLSRNVDVSSSPEPFVLQHGLFSNSGQWLFLEPKQSLAFMLADHGFDVWMTNIRGNMYSRKHNHLSPNSREFWDYSWHEHGIIDMPAIIDFILNTTRHEKVWYSGHSMGTTMFFVMGSMRPAYNKKIRHMFALAPVAYMSHLKFEAKNLASHVRTFEAFARTALGGVFKTDFLLMQLAKFGVCRTLGKPCAEALSSSVGPNPQSNTTVTLKALQYMPDYATAGQIAHYAQLMNKEFTFAMYDYYDQNMVKYKTTEPPRYPVEKITAPVTFLYSRNDYLAEPIDVETFSKNLPNVRMYVISDPKFNHFDYITATYADEVVYKPMLEMIQQHRISEKSQKNSLTEG